MSLTIVADRETAQPGDFVLYTLTYENDSGELVENLELSCIVPSQFILTGPIRWPLSDVDAGAVVPVTASLALRSNLTPADGPIVVNATATSDNAPDEHASETVRIPIGQSLFTSQSPAGVNAGSFELGMNFSADISGQIVSVRFWKAPGETGPHIGRVWSASGHLLASAVFANETASGWQEQALITPLGVLANQAYTVSVNVNALWSWTNGFFASPLTTGHLRGTAGVYGVPTTFPMTPYQGYNYFRDVVFVPGDGTQPDVQPTTLDAVSLALTRLAAALQARGILTPK